MTYEGVTMRDESLLIENHASVRRIWLNRADAANAQTRGMLVALDEAIAAAADDDTVRVIILAGKGKHSPRATTSRKPRKNARISRPRSAGATRSFTTSTTA